MIVERVVTMLVLFLQSVSEDTAYFLYGSKIISLFRVHVSLSMIYINHAILYEKGEKISNQKHGQTITNVPNCDYRHFFHHLMSYFDHINNEEVKIYVKKLQDGNKSVGGTEGEDP